MNEPLTVNINFKGQLWSADLKYWTKHAPETLSLLNYGIEGGKFSSDGSSLLVLELASEFSDYCQYGTVAIDSTTVSVRLTATVGEVDHDEGGGSIFHEGCRFQLPNTTKDLLNQVNELADKLTEACKTAPTRAEYGY